MNVPTETRDWPLDALKEHPRQRDYFPAPTAEELQELADDLLRRGQQEPVHISPDGTIYRGHRRAEAARRLGWDTIRVRVRHDLPDPTAKAAVEDLVRDNTTRQQLDDLTLARCYLALKDAEAGREGEVRGDVRDTLAVRIGRGLSGRSLDRKLRLLKLPRDIQDMYSRRALNQNQAEKLLSLPAPSRELAFDDLRSGRPIREVLTKYVTGTQTVARPLSDRGIALVATLRNELPLLREHLAALDRVQVPGCDVIEILDEAATFLADWANRKRTLRNQSVAAMQVRLP